MKNKGTTVVHVAPEGVLETFGASALELGLYDEPGERGGMEEAAPATRSVSATSMRPAWTLME